MMRRLVIALCAVAFLSSCGTERLSTLPQDLTLAAQEQLQKTLAAQFRRELGKGVDAVIADLGRPGGFLDNPLVRIALPPPLGLALDVTRDLHADPQAKLLSVLMNRAAEQAVPGAAPVLKAALSGLGPDEARRLFADGGTAATDALKAKATVELRKALAPAVAASLAAGGAPQVYSDLMRKQPAPEAAPRDLTGYVTDQAVAGVFKQLGEQETQIRERIANPMNL